MGDHCQQLNTTMQGIMSNYSDDQIKNAQKAFSQKQILEETGNVSNDIALSFGNSVEIVDSPH